MNYLERLKSILVAEAGHRLYVPIPNERVDPAPSDGEFVADECYLRIWLTDLYLAHRRVLFQTRSPLVHASCRFLYWGAEQQLPLVAGPGQIEGMGAALDRAVNLNYRLLGPVPFRGGEVELFLALVAVQEADYGDQLLDVLGALSLLTGRGELKLALQLVQPLKRGVEGFFGLGESEVQLGLHDTFSASPNAPNRLTPGYRVVMDAADQDLDQGSLWVKDGRLCTGPTLESAALFEGADYLLFYLERVGRRDDIAGMVSIQQAWDEAISKARGSTDDELDIAYDTFKGTVLGSPDLIWDDQAELIERLKERVRAVRALRDRLGMTAADLDTSLAGAVAESLQSPSPRSQTREEILGLSWR